MTHLPRLYALCGFAALAASGCSATGAKTACCTGCAMAIVAPPASYEHYTPPQPTLSPIPLPPDAKTEDPAPPPPPETRTAPDKNFDFFDNAQSESQNILRR